MKNLLLFLQFISFDFHAVSSETQIYRGQLKIDENYAVAYFCMPQDKSSKLTCSPIAMNSGSDAAKSTGEGASVYVAAWKSLQDSNLKTGDKVVLNGVWSRSKSSSLPTLYAASVKRTE